MEVTTEVAKGTSSETLPVLALERPLNVLRLEYIRGIDDASSELGSFGEVRPIKQHGKLRFIQRVWKWLWVVVLGTLLAAGVTYGVSSQLPPVDRASASLLPRDSALPSNNGDGTAYFVEAAYPGWRTSVYPPEAIPLDHVQQIGHVFILPGTDGALVVPGGFVMPQLIELVHAANREIFIGVGGASSHDEFVSMVSDPTDRATFVQNLTDFVIEHGYDGVEIDWEFPQTAAQSQNLNALMAELRTSLDATGQDLQLNIAVSSGEWFGRWIDVEAITPLVDYYLVMTYSYHSGWSAQSGHNAPLYSPPPGVDDPISVDQSIRYWAETRGVPRSKIVMGLASYGISFNSENLYQSFTSFGQAYYSDIRPLIGNGYTRHWDSTCQVPYLTQDAGPTLWSYDDPQSIGLKCDYAVENNLAGVAIWDVTGDRIDGQQELLEMVAERCISPTVLSPRVYLPIIQKQR